MIEPQRKETAQQRVARVDAELAKWRTSGAAYLVLCTNGIARSAGPGKLRAVLAWIKKNDPDAHLIELADPQCREFFIAWALAPKGGKAN